MGGQPVKGAGKAVAKDAVKGVVKGAATGGVAGAVKGAGKAIFASKEGRKQSLKVAAVVAALLATLAAPVVVVLLSVIGGIGGTASQGIARGSVTAAVTGDGMAGSTVGALNAASSETGAPWEIMAAIVYYTSAGPSVSDVPGTCPTGTAPGIVCPNVSSSKVSVSTSNPFGLTPHTPGLSATGRAQLPTAGVWVGQRIMASVRATPGWTAQDLISGAITASGGAGGLSVDPTNGSAAFVRSAYEDALSKLPLTGNTPTMDANIFWLGLDWALGNAPVPAPGTGSDACSASASGGASGPGVDAQQLANAAIIVGEAKKLGLPIQADIIAIMTGLQESSLEDLPNSAVPGSETDPNVQWGNYSPSNPPSNGTSVGIFQQQNNWGSVTRRMDVAESAATFFGKPSPPMSNPPRGLLQVPNWQSLPLGVAAQDVQVSAFPTAYAKWQAQATAIVGAALKVKVTFTCQTTSSIKAYKNPLRSILGLTPERIDMGVDYAGSGTIFPIGDGVVTDLTNAGWPGPTHGFVCYQLTDGPAKGLYVYVAENVTPLVHVGEHVTPNTRLALLHNASPNLETGWAAAPGDGNSLADTMPGAFNGQNSTAAGINFNKLLVAVGAPTGILQVGLGPPGPSLPSAYKNW